MKSHAALVALVLAQTSPLSPRFEPVQPDLLSAGGTLVNAAADYDGDGDRTRTSSFPPVL